MSSLTCIALATYNRLELTKQTITSLYANTNSPFNLTIIDNDSSDGTQEWLKENIKKNEFCQSFQLVFNSENKGIAYARNQGLKIGSQFNPDFYCTLDNDVELPQNWLLDITSAIKDNPNYCIGVNYEGVYYSASNINGHNLCVKQAGNLGTACSLFSKKLFQDIGFFNSNYNLKYSAEDAQYFFRARKAGYQMAYLPTPGIHLGENEVGEYREWKTKCHADSLPSFIKDCHEISAGIKPVYTDFKED